MKSKNFSTEANKKTYKQQRNERSMKILNVHLKDYSKDINSRIPNRIGGSLDSKNESSAVVGFDKKYD